MKAVQNGNVKRRIIAVIITLLLISIIVVVVVSEHRGDTSNGAVTEMSDSKDDVSAYAFLESQYIRLKYPVELMATIIREQDTYESRYTEAFYMKRIDEDIPLFRFDFADDTAGEWIGLLHTEFGDIAVTSVVFALNDEEYAALSDADREMYSSCMNAYSVMLEGIMADPRFTSEKPLSVGDDTEMKTTYWTLTLPSNMTIVETNENATYVAMFYGNVAGERTALYTVHIGDDQAESELGLYEADGVKKPISVGSFDLSERTNWTEDDYSAAYRMMDTINHVIETIMNSEQFSIPVEEPEQALGEIQ